MTRHTKLGYYGVMIAAAGVGLALSASPLLAYAEGAPVASVIAEMPEGSTTDVASVDAETTAIGGQEGSEDAVEAHGPSAAFEFESDTAGIDDASGDVAANRAAEGVAPESEPAGSEVCETVTAGEESSANDLVPAGGDGHTSAEGLDVAGDMESAKGGSASASSADMSVEVTLAADQDLSGTTEEEAPKNGWYDADGNPASAQTGVYWYDYGVLAASKEVWDPTSDAWYWFDADGTLARDKDVYLRDGDKWVRYDSDGHMVKGQDCRLSEDDGQWHWWYFEPVTGAMQKTFSYVRDEDKWCYYDATMGWMLYGELFAPGDNNEWHWYYLELTTGAMQKGFSYVREKDKWCYYDTTTGCMLYGAQLINDRPYYFDPCTGRQWMHDELVNNLVSFARTTQGTSVDCIAALAAAGGKVCNIGPCMSYVWWCFDQVGLGLFVANGAISGWPNHNFDWYATRGRADMSPQVGDIVFWRYSGWADSYGASASHAGIVVGINGNGTAQVVDALYDGVWERTYDMSSIVGFAHPYWD